MIKASVRIQFKTVWYNPRLDLLACPIWLGGLYFYEHENTGALRPIVDKTEWVYIDFI